MLCHDLFKLMCSSDIVQVAQFNWRLILWRSCWCVGGYSLGEDTIFLVRLIFYFLLCSCCLPAQILPPWLELLYIYPFEYVRPRFWME